MHSFERFSAPYNPYHHNIKARQTGGGRFKQFWKSKVKPVLRSVGSRALKHGLKLGTRVASDIVLKRKAPAKALKSRVKQTLEEIQRGQGIKKRPTRTPGFKRQETTAADGKKKRRQRDIFDY